MSTTASVVLPAPESTTHRRGESERPAPPVPSQASEVASFAYERDRLGRLTTQRVMLGGTPTTSGYGYDLAGRLETVSENGVLVRTYGYDANSNRVKLNGRVVGTYDAQDRLTSYRPEAGLTYTYTYTANGELKSQTTPQGTTEYDYDVFGNLITVTLPDTRRIEYVIDGQDRRIGKRVNSTLVQGFLYRDQLNPIVELDGSGRVLSRFVYADKPHVPAYLIRDGVRYRIISDHLGSPRVVVDTRGGTVVQRMDFDAFGRVLRDTHPGFQPFGFAGGLYDRDAGLVRFGARDYNPQTGRWTAKDPSGCYGRDANLYRYAFSDPVNFRDPGGENPIAIGAGAGAVMGGPPGAAVGAVAGLVGGLVLGHIIFNEALSDEDDDGGDDGRHQKTKSNRKVRKTKKGANRQDKKQIDDVAREVGIPENKRHDFGKFLEKEKKRIQRGGRDNFDRDQLWDLAEEFKEEFCK
ncbi:RHS repeat domain-containing protein [Candidatus Entotheonella palauensis]|uniref:RHS repeat domain-containing protein n=1 Tax=Candidatus Entotheonella palauensis TaxID=93172 RepID=UPI0015C4A8C7|nr:RHS repeat-associated core domain-containing protein [Candidatus Entotheonella palauensis]